MRLWLVSFLILFFGAEGLQWFGQLHWFSGVEFSVPVVVIGGIGLAIASNYRLVQSLGLLPETHPTPKNNPFPTRRSTPTIDPAPTQTVQSPSVGSQTQRQEKSISFTIHKPKPISFTIQPSQRPKK
jgi:hypothetical protein